MTIFEIIQAVTSILGLIAIILLWWQIRSDLKWKRINMSLGKFDSLFYYDNFNRVKEYLDIDEDEEDICEIESEEIIEEGDTSIPDKITKILNMSDELAVLYNLKLLDKNTVYELYGSRIRLIYLRFKKIIEFYREERKNPLAYNNLEKCAKAFIKEREKRNHK